jgi:hypothetical protein
MAQLPWTSIHEPDQRLPWSTSYANTFGLGLGDALRLLLRRPLADISSELSGQFPKGLPSPIPPANQRFEQSQ